MKEWIALRLIVTAAVLSCSYCTIFPDSQIGKCLKFYKRGKTLCEANQNPQKISLPLRTCFQTLFFRESVAASTPFHLLTAVNTKHTHYSLRIRDSRAHTLRGHKIFKCSTVFWSTQFGVCYLNNFFHIRKQL